MKPLPLLIVVLVLLAAVPGIVSAQKEIEKPAVEKIKDVKDPAEKAKIKAQEIAKVKTAGEKVRDDKPNKLRYDLQYISFDKTKNALKLKVRVWLNGKEKMIHNPVWIYNPPVLIVTSSSYDAKKDEYSYTTKEDMSAALDDTIYRVAMMVPDGEATFEGPDPTLMVFASHDAEVVERTDASFAVLRAAAGDTVDTTANTLYTLIVSTATANVFSEMGRGIFVFNTSIGAGNTVNSARLDIFIGNKYSALGAPNMSITGVVPASYTVLTVEDYRRVYDVKYTNDVPYDQIVPGAFVNISFLPAVLPYAINKTGFTSVDMRLRWDAENSMTGLVWISGTGGSGFYVRSVDYLGTSSDPALLVEYTVPEPETVTEDPDFNAAIALLLPSIGFIGIFALSRRKKKQDII